MTRYFCNDFDFKEWADAVAGSCSLPEIQTHETSSNQIEAPGRWDDFFQHHNSGSFFKPRKYLSKEFSSFLGDSATRLVLECGCGHGCSMFPLLKEFEFDYIATDFSGTALDVLTEHESFPLYRHRVVLQAWDITRPFETSLQASMNIDAVLCIFVLSALAPSDHLSALNNMGSLLKTKKGVILFRDYGIHDMTMYRHRVRNEETFFTRNDGTLAFYFSKEYVLSLLLAANMEAVELEYATVQNVNRKTREVMNRVFLHGVFRLK
jgi:SAM-dependent methyltransferase